jgi:hypothetical protein
MGRPHRGQGMLPSTGGDIISLFLKHRPSVGEVFEDERLLHARCVHPFIGEVLPLVVLQVGKK